MLDPGYALDGFLQSFRARQMLSAIGTAEVSYPASCRHSVRHKPPWGFHGFGREGRSCPRLIGIDLGFELYSGPAVLDPHDCRSDRLNHAQGNKDKVSCAQVSRLIDPHPSSRQVTDAVVRDVPAADLFQGRAQKHAGSWRALGQLGRGQFAGDGFDDNGHIRPGIVRFEADLRGSY
jgi:hypothetical protein